MKEGIREDEETIYFVTNDRGTIAVKVEGNSPSHVISSKYEVVHLEIDDRLEEYIKVLEDLPLESRYASKYKDKLKEAYLLYGYDGLVTQILYMQSNISRPEYLEVTDMVLENIERLKTKQEVKQ